jgi:hypothetical protein
MVKSMSLTNRHVAFQFKGERDYVHGTDIYNSIRNALLTKDTQSLPSTFTQFKLAIRKPSHHHCRLDISPISSTDGKPDTAVVEFQFIYSKQAYKGWLSETDGPVSERYEYSEAQALAGCTVSTKSANLINCHEYTTVENLVAATKQLHLTQFPDANGKWFFSRLELAQLLPSQTDQLLTITLNQSVGQRLTRSDIQIDSQRVGSIYFSLVPA